MREYIVVDREEVDSPVLGVLAKKLKINKDQVLGMLCRLRLWFICNTEAGVAHGMTTDEVDVILDVDGAGEAFIACNFLARDDNGLSIPRIRSLQATHGRRSPYLKKTKSKLTLAQECLRAEMDGATPSVQPVEEQPKPRSSTMSDAKTRQYLVDTVARTVEVGSILRQWGDSGADLKCSKSEGRKAIAHALLNIQDTHGIDKDRAYKHLVMRLTKFKTHAAWHSKYRVGAMRWFMEGYYDEEELWDNMKEGKQEGNVLPTEDLRDAAAQFLEEQQKQQKRSELIDHLREHNDGV